MPKLAYNFPFVDLVGPLCLYAKNQHTTKSWGYDYSMFLDPPKQDQHVPDIDKGELHVLTSHKVSLLKVNNVMGVLQFFKPSFGWHTQQTVAATTTFSGTNSLYYIFHGSQCHSNLVTSPFSCVLLTLQSVLNQNLTCQPSSSYCRIPMILDTLKNELKSPFTANITKGFLPHADKNWEYFCEQHLHNGNENGEHICVENFHGNNLNPHNMNKLSCSPQETQHLCLPEICLGSVGPGHQPSKIYESLIGILQCWASFSTPHDHLSSIHQVCMDSTRLPFCKGNSQSWTQHLWS